MRRKSFISLSGIILLTLLLTLLKIPVASSQAPALVAAGIEDELPVQDLNSPLWLQSTAIDVPLSAQAISRPMPVETKVKSVTARALYNKSQLAILVEWSDETENNQTLRVQDFRDAVALQFPLVSGQPFFCMGMQGGNVDIWHWKADWQADIANWQDMEAVYPDMDVDQYPFAEGKQPKPGDYSDVNYLPALAAENLFASPRLSPVEDLMAGGFGSLTSEPVAEQNIQGYGAWDNGRWRVIFSRGLSSPDGTDASFAEGAVYSIAFAAWDGANGERNGQKSTSQWLSFQLGGSASSTPSAQPSATPAAPGEEAVPTVLGIPRNTLVIVIYAVFALFIIIGAFIYIRLPD